LAELFTARVHVFEECFALGLASNSLSIKDGETRALYCVPVKANGVRVVGLYQPAREGENVSRRLTGGADITVNTITVYIGVAFRAKNLAVAAEKLYALASRLCHCNNAGPRCGKCVLGVSISEETAYAEILGPHLLLDVLDTGLQRVFGSKLHRLEVAEDDIDRRLVASFTNPRWRWYEGAEKAQLRTIVRGKDGFNMRIGMWYRDCFIERFEVDGIFYAAPPFGIYNVFASLEGVPMHQREIVIAGLEAVLGGSIDVYGVGIKDIINAVDELFCSLNRNADIEIMLFVR